MFKLFVYKCEQFVMKGCSMQNCAVTMATSMRETSIVNLKGSHFEEIQLYQSPIYEYSNHVKNTPVSYRIAFKQCSYVNENAITSIYIEQFLNFILRFFCNLGVAKIFWRLHWDYLVIKSLQPYLVTFQAFHSSLPYYIFHVQVTSQFVFL